MTVSSFFRISAAFLARWAASFSAREASLTARICTARKAAFFAPSTATVATGMPEGICTVLSRASSPSRAELMGMPMTGSVVAAARAPARWAAIPAAAMMTPKPLALALRAKALASSGVRWAE